MEKIKKEDIEFILNIIARCACCGEPIKLGWFRIFLIKIMLWADISKEEVVNIIHRAQFQKNDC